MTQSAARPSNGETRYSQNWIAGTAIRVIFFESTSIAN
jgi:hypothetical protein